MALVELRKNPSPAELKWFGVLVLVLCGLVGAAARWRFDSPRLAVAIWAFGLLVAAAYYALRPLRRPLYLAWVHLFYPAGWLVSHLVMAALFFLVITPLGLALRLMGHDPLRLRLDGAVGSYWERRPPARAMSRYFEPF